MNHSRFFLTIATIAAIASACQKADHNVPIGSGNNTTTGTRIAPVGFNYATTKKISVTASAFSNNNKPIPGVMITVYTYAADTLQRAIFKGLTGSDGTVSAVVTVPAACDTLVIDPAFIGLLRLGKAPINGSTVNAIFGGTQGFGGSIVSSLTANTNTNIPLHPYGGQYRNHPGGNTNGFSTAGTTNLSPMGTCDELGVPDYLYKPSDIVDVNNLLTINASLPEGVDATQKHPEWFGKNALTDVNVTQDAEVWISFMFQGTPSNNSLGWYQYKSGNPPKTIDDIDSIHFIFPNAKFKGGGGGLFSGDKVDLGQFAAGTSIGFVILVDAWGGSGNKINYYNNKGAFFTDSWLNPEQDANLQQHAILFKDNDLALIGFEDMNRENGSDNDFNDVMFYASASPSSAIQQGDMVVLPNTADSDGDGVPDYEDAFPNDPARAYITFYPGKDTWGTIAFEDNWPAVGDYDMNDLVVSYQYKLISDAKNNTVEFFASYAPIASGATFNNGFGVQFPFSPSQVNIVKGQSLKQGYTKQNANGTEANQKNAVIIPFDNVRNLINNFDGNLFVNTLPYRDRVSGDTSVVYLQFTSPVSANTFPLTQINPFAISNMRRGYEIHLPNYAPTDLANTKLFGTDNDASDPANGIYYVTKDNHPWALDFAGKWLYPIETKPLSGTYLHFLDWAGSGGAAYNDWYFNTDPGYQYTDALYTK